MTGCVDARVRDSATRLMMARVYLSQVLTIAFVKPRP